MFQISRKIQSLFTLIIKVILCLFCSSKQILNDNSNIDEVLDNSINDNILFKEKELFGLDLILSIIEFAFYSSKDKVKNKKNNNQLYILLNLLSIFPQKFFLLMKSFLNKNYRFN